MMIDQLQNIAQTVTSATFIWVYGAAILAVLCVSMLSFFRRTIPLARSLKNTVKSLSRTKTMVDFAAEFPEIDEELCANELLRHPWEEFKETLLFPGDELSADEVEIHNTHPAGMFFSQESIIAPRLNLRFFNALPGILTAMGILGTFLGLVSGIYLASGGLAADDIDKAKEALSALLRGASLAFSTSIVGLFSSMVATALEKKFLHRLDGYVETLVICLDHRVKRLPGEQIQAKILRENQQQTAALQSFTNDLAVKFAEILDENVRKPMGESMDLLLESLDLLRSDRAATNEEMLSGVVSQFQDSISGAAGTEMKALGETLDLLNEQFKEHIQANQENQEESTAQLIMVAEEFQKSLEKVESLTLQNTQLVSESNSLVSSVRAGQEKIGTTVELLNGVSTQILKVSSDVIDAAGILKDSSIDVKAAVENLAAIEENIQEVWDDYGTRFEEVDVSLAECLKDIQEGLSAYSSNLSGYVQDIEKEVSKIVSHLAGGTRGLEDAVTDLTEVMASSVNQAEQ